MDFYGLRVHFIGIGGIGVSGLARFLNAQGAVVSGSDIKDTSITQTLRNEKIEINIPHSKEVIADKDVIIHSAIIKDSNVEIIESKRLGKQILSRKDALKILLSKKKVLSVCAAHGKSSTSAILASILSKSGAIIGAISKEFQSNVRVSKDDLLVFEADESDKSFLNSNPYKSIVINAEAEHLESYNNDFTKLQDAYLEFMQLSSHVILNMKCEVLQNLYGRLLEKQSIEGKSLESGSDNLQDDSKNSEIKAQNNPAKITCLYPEEDIKDISYEIRNFLPYTTFSLRDLGRFSIYGIGYHNALNASMAILSALDLLPLEEIRRNILSFRGIKKRFDILQNLQECKPCIIDDYAHHPTEITATLEATRKYVKLLQNQKTLSKDSKNNYNITVIFQPHKYSRLRDNLEAFCNCFGECDRLIILPVWAAGEKKIDFDFARLFGKYNPTFAQRIKRDGEKILLLDSKNCVTDVLESGIIIGLGAGDITYQLRGEQ